MRMRMGKRKDSGLKCFREAPNSGVRIKTCFRNQDSVAGAAASSAVGQRLPAEVDQPSLGAGSLCIC